jgi:hypothetical protein
MAKTDERRPVCKFCAKVIDFSFFFTFLTHLSCGFEPFNLNSVEKYLMAHQLKLVAVHFSDMKTSYAYKFYFRAGPDFFS